MLAFAETLHAAFHRPETPVYRWVQGAIWILIALSLVLLGFELGLDPADPLHHSLVSVDRIVLWLFGVELALRVLSFRPPALQQFELSPLRRARVEISGRLRFCLSPLMLIDIVTVAALVPALRGLRFLRLLRLLRSARLLRYSNPFQGLERAFQENAVLFTFALSLFGASTLLGGVSFYLTENKVNPDLHSVADGIWWAVVTLTTVGFGDISPVTGVGRIVGAVLMVAGMFHLALFAGVVGNTLLHVVLSVREEQFRMSGYMDHVVICGYDPGARMLLDAALQEIEPSGSQIVLFSQGSRPAGIPMEIMWVSGDPTKESELDKVRLTHARAAIVVGSRAATPQHADATTILTAFTIRSYLAAQEETGRRRRPLYLVAEILDAENVAHAYAAGVDEVIESTRLGFSLMAHAVVMPGTAAVASEMSTAGANSLFVGHPPVGVELPTTFGTLARQLRCDHRALLLGVRDAETGADRLNPEDQSPVKAGDRLIYLAESAVSALSQ